MNTNLLLISPIEVVLFLLVLLSIVITALVLASKNEKNMNFLIWVLIILFIPFFGGVCYLIKHYTSSKKSLI